MKGLASVGSSGEEGEGQPQSTLWAPTILLALVTVNAAGIVWRLVDSADRFPSGISKDNIILILFLILSDFNENATASPNDDTALSFDDAFGSCIVSSLSPFRRDAVNSLPSSESRRFLSHPLSPLTGYPIVR